MDQDSDTATRTMNLRLCLRIGLQPTWTSFALANHASQCSIFIYRHDRSPTYEVNVCVELNTGLLQELRHLFTPVGYNIQPEGAMQLRSVTSPMSGQNQRISDCSSDVTDTFDRLEASIENDSIFDLDEGRYFELLGDVYSAELDYLRTAYVAITASGPQTKTKAPSEYLFEERFGEVDRTLCGLNALRWIHQGDYDSYTNNQAIATKLSRKTFGTIRDLFQRYTKPQEILTLITMQMTNDLGKSSKLQSLYYQTLSDESHSHVNHDMMLYFVVRDRPDLVPSFQYLPVAEQQLVQELLCVSAEFNPAQLIQAECPPEVMSILQEQHWSEDHMRKALDRKFLELILDLSGALGQIDHEGAKTMTEPVARSLLHALEVSKLVAGAKITLQEAYNQVLEHRLELIKEAGWTERLDIRENRRDFTKARLFCMGRVDNPQKADLFDRVYDNLPDEVQRDLEWGMRIDHDIARQATYMPSMISSCNTPEQLTVSFEYLARVLFISQSDLDALRSDENGELPGNIAIVERDVLPIVKPLIRDHLFKDQPASMINQNTPLPELQVLKVSRDRRRSLVGDEWIRQQ